MSTLLAAFNKSIASELNDRLARNPSSTIDWSSEQQPVLDWFANPSPSASPSLVVIARAGTGKTTVIMEGARRAPESTSIVAKTLHSLGFGIVRRFWEGIKISNGNRRAWQLAATAAPNAPDPVLKCISTLLTKGREIVPFARRGDELFDLAVRFDCEPDEFWEDYGWDVHAVCEAAARAMELASKKPMDGEIDFTDMIYLPVRNRWTRPTYDLVVVDEAQDMNSTQILLAQGVCRERLVVVGDPRQAIYGFRGADSEVLSRIVEERAADVLHLTTTFRCARSIVELAAKLVPDFQAGVTNPEGVVDDLWVDDLLDVVDPSAAVLSRTNAPLISLALKALRRGIPAVVAGQDIAAGLRALVKKLATGRAKNSVPAFTERLVAWQGREVERAGKLPEELRKTKTERVYDQAEALFALADGVSGVGEIYARIDRLFEAAKEGTAIVFSSVHKAKGLEWERVFVLDGTLRAGGEESNIAYVAYTRAKAHLTLVG